MSFRNGFVRGLQANRRRNNGQNAAMRNKLQNARNGLRNRPVNTPEEAEELENQDNQLAQQEKQANKNQKQGSNNKSSGGLQDTLRRFTGNGDGGSFSSEAEESGDGNFVKKKFKQKAVKYSIIALIIIFVLAVFVFIIISPLLSIASIVDEKTDYNCDTIYVRKLYKHEFGYVLDPDEVLANKSVEDLEKYEKGERDKPPSYIYVYNKTKGEDGYVEYDFEEYVAAVVTGEVGSLSKWNEVLKALAVAARSYGMAKTNPLLDCKIEASDLTQTISTKVSEEARKAAKDTKGEVLTKNGEVYLPMYDAFACIDRVNKNGIDYYVLNQPSSDEHQMIPVSWISENGISLEQEWTTCNETHPGNHGEGMSQVGAAYLADELDYDYHEILFYYYSDDLDSN